MASNTGHSSATSSTLMTFSFEKRDINSLIPITGIYRTDINMSFKLDKCNQRLSKRCNIISTEGVELPERNIGNVQNSYKYHGIPKANGNYEEIVRKSAKYLYRLKQVPRSQLNGRGQCLPHQTWRPGADRAKLSPRQCSKKQQGARSRPVKANLECHNQMAGIGYRNIYAEYGLQVPGSKWATLPKVIEND